MSSVPRSYPTDNTAVNIYPRPYANNTLKARVLAAVSLQQRQQQQQQQLLQQQQQQQREMDHHQHHEEMEEEEEEEEEEEMCAIDLTVSKSSSSSSSSRSPPVDNRWRLSSAAYSPAHCNSSSVSSPLSYTTSECDFDLKGKCCCCRLSLTPAHNIFVTFSSI